MAIQFRRGAESDLVSANLLPAEPAYCTDTHKLVVGRGGGVNDLMLTETQAAQLVAATPLVASDTTGMTDTTRMYVLTTDGYLYHYNGTSWVSTGVQYQSTGIANGSITTAKIADEAVDQSKLSLDAKDANNLGYEVDYLSGVIESTIYEAITELFTRSGTADSAIDSLFDHVTVTDESSSKDYLIKFKLINGKPVLEMTEYVKEV